VSTEPNSELSRRREEVFREIGRNVVMFQDIERMMKILLNRGKFIATASQLKEWKDKPPAPYARRMLGELIEPLMENHLSPAVPGGPSLPESKEITIGFEFRVELNEGQSADFKRRLEEMVAKRNHLIHHLLEWLRLDTVETCQAAVQRLQQQRDETEPLHRDLSKFLRVFFETSKDVASYLKENPWNK
jgi:hypothetical protein